MKRLVPAAAVLLSAAVFASAAFATANAAPNRSEPSARPALNQVIVWNRVLLGILRTPGAQPATIHPTRSLAMLHLAIADAVDAIARRFAPYHFAVRAAPHSSLEAAAASAAHDVLVALYPQQRAGLDAQLAGSLASVPDGAGKSAGSRIGKRAAQAILGRRANDGSSLQAAPFMPGRAAGDYQLTPPGFAAPVFTNWSTVAPFALARAAQFRPGPPPAPSSTAYAGALAEVRAAGVATGSSRTADQTQIGQFWSAPIQNYWNEIAQTAALAHGDSVTQDARLFAVLNVALADVAIAFYDAKYAYRFWRPITAIRADGAAADANWTPLAKTPPDPSYPGAHSVISFAAATTLAEAFGNRFGFAVGSEALPGVTRRFASFGAAAEEAGLSRIYAGVHYRFDHAAGKRLGREVAGYVARHVLQERR